MIDGPDVEFLLREKDFMIKAKENDLREDFSLFQRTIRHHQGSFRQGAFYYVQTPVPQVFECMGIHMMGNKMKVHMKSVIYNRPGSFEFLGSTFPCSNFIDKVAVFKSFFKLTKYSFQMTLFVFQEKTLKTVTLLHM